VRQGQFERDDPEMYQVGQQVDQGLGLAFVTDIGELDVGDLKQFLRAQVD